MSDQEHPFGIPVDGKRSKFEAQVEAQLIAAGVKPEYEPESFKYSLKYIPDFKLPNGVYLECKGWFQPEDRTKMLRVRETNPGVDIRFVFQQNNKLSPESNMRYGDWCDKHGFKWCVKNIPTEWLDTKIKTGE